MSLEKENSLVNEEESIYEINNWDDLEISPDLLRGIYAYGFEKPSPIQRKAIKPLVSGKDVIAQAQSGTGKTATFTIGVLSHINIDNKTSRRGWNMYGFFTFIIIFNMNLTWCRST